jgi:hypothetical protein
MASNSSAGNTSLGCVPFSKIAKKHGEPNTYVPSERSARRSNLPESSGFVAGHCKACGFEDRRKCPPSTVDEEMGKAAIHIGRKLLPLLYYSG